MHLRALGGRSYLMPPLPSSLDTASTSQPPCQGISGTWFCQVRLAFFHTWYISPRFSAWRTSLLTTPCYTPDLPSTSPLPLPLRRTRDSGYFFCQALRTSLFVSINPVFLTDWTETHFLIKNPCLLVVVSAILAVYLSGKRFSAASTAQALCFMLFVILFWYLRHFSRCSAVVNFHPPVRIAVFSPIQAFLSPCPINTC